MSSAPDHEAALPVRVPRSRTGGGRHRRPESVEVPPDAPVLVLAVPGAYTSEHRFLGAELAGLARAEQPGADVRYGFLEGSEDALGAVLAQCAAERSADTEGPAAIVVPLTAAPHTAVEERARAVVVESGVRAVVTTSLGPHPLLAEALHVRLSEAGLARADRARLFAVSTAADGIVLAATGGPDAVEATDATGVLLAARLAVQVLTVSLDDGDAVVGAVERLRAAGARRPVVAAAAVGPELPEGLPARIAEKAGCPCAEPIGAYGGIARLALLRYTAALPAPVPEEARS